MSLLFSEKKSWCIIKNTVMNDNEMPENDGKIYGFCNGAWVVIAEVGKNVYTD